MVNKLLQKNLPKGIFLPKWSHCFFLQKIIGDGDKFSCHIMRIFDSDGNGFLDFKEFLMAIDIATCQTEESKLAWAFKLYDLVTDLVFNHYLFSDVIPKLSSLAK